VRGRFASSFLVIIATERVCGMNAGGRAAKDQLRPSHGGSVTSEIPLPACYRIFSDDLLDWESNSGTLGPDHT
jgi:hypothetical protein